MLLYSDFVNSYLTTPKMVRDLVNYHPDSITAGYTICDYRATTHYLQPSQNHAPYLLADGTNDATQFLLGNPQITFSDANDANRTASWQFNGTIASQIDTIKIVVKLSRCYYDWAGNRILEVPRGYFMPIIPDREIVDDDADSLLDCTGTDETKILQDIFPLHPCAMPAGLNVKTCFMALLMMDDRTPAEGGRSPSGVAVAGGSQDGLGVTPYTTAGVDILSYATDSATGYKKSPDGPYGFVFYNPYGGARADATTHAPIDPWTGVPMSPLPSLTSHAGGATVIWLASRPAIAYNSAQGVFYHMNSTSTLDVSFPYDVFKSIPVPAGVIYKANDILNPPFGVIGSALPPLASWDRDYDGGGPYFTSTPAPPPTTTSGGSADGLYAQSGAILAQRSSAIDIVLMPPGTYVPEQGTSFPDPQSPSTTQIAPRGVSGSPFYVDGPSTGVGQTFAPQTWTVNVRLQGYGVGSGTISLAQCDVYERTALSTYLHRGTLTPGDSYSFAPAPTTQLPTLQASGSVPGFTAGSGSEISFLITLQSTGLFSNAAAASPATLTFLGWVTGAAPIGATSVPPTSSGTVIPWPDSNNPAMAPNGCVCYSSNWPASRINVPDTPFTLPVTNVWDKQTPLYAKLQELCTIAGWNPFGIDEYGNIVTEAQDYFNDSSLPVIEKTYSNILPQEDAFYVYPLTQRLLDQQNMANVVESTSSSNQTGEGIVSIMTNDAPSSPLAYSNAGRRIIRIFQNDALGSQEQVDADALNHLYAAAEAGNAIEIQAPIDPFLSRRNHVNVIHQLPDLTRDLDATLNPLRVNAWSEELDNPIQRLVCGSTVAIVDTSGGGTGGTGGGTGGAVGGAIGEPIGSPI